MFCGVDSDARFDLDSDFHQNLLLILFNAFEPIILLLEKFTRFIKSLFMSDEELMEATMTKSAPVRWQRVFIVG
jgi:hypothetical protein